MNLDLNNLDQHTTEQPLKSLNDTFRLLDNLKEYNMGLSRDQHYNREINGLKNRMLLIQEIAKRDNLNKVT